jgi:hypothetical protein
METDPCAHETLAEVEVVAWEGKNSRGLLNPPLGWATLTFPRAVWDRWMTAVMLKRLGRHESTHVLSGR